MPDLGGPVSRSNRANHMPKKTTLPKGHIIYLMDSYQDIWISGIDSKHGIKSIPPVVTVTNDEKKAVRFKTARDARAFVKKYSLKCCKIESPAVQDFHHQL